MTDVEEYDDLPGPTLLKRTLGMQNKHHSRYIGATGGLEPCLGIYGEAQLTEGVLRRVSPDDAFLILPDENTQNYADEVDDSDAIEAVVRPHGSKLIALYFRIVHPSFPVLHKEVYLEKYSRSHREFPPSLLAAVYLMGLKYWTYDDELSGLPKPNVEQLEALAKKTFRDTIHRPKLGTVQSGLLLSQRQGTSLSHI